MFVYKVKYKMYRKYRMYRKYKMYCKYKMYRKSLEPPPLSLSLKAQEYVPRKFKEEFNSRRPNPRATSFDKQSLGE